MLRRTLFWLGVLALGAAGYVLMALIGHLLIDHERFHQVWELELRRDAAARSLPPAPPAPKETP